MITLYLQIFVERNDIFMKNFDIRIGTQTIDNDTEFILKEGLFIRMRSLSIKRKVQKNLFQHLKNWSRKKLLLYLQKMQSTMILKHLQNLAF